MILPIGVQTGFSNDGMEGFVGHMAWLADLWNFRANGFDEKTLYLLLLVANQTI